MRALSLAVLLIVAVVALCVFAGCGDDESPKDTGVPTVVNTSPVDGATDVSPYPIVQVWFSEAMDPATIDTLTFYVTGLRAHSVAYDDAAHKATLYPAKLAEAGTEYDVHVEAGVEDADGNAIGDDVVFAFTTGERDCAHLSDRFEPNDVIASATPVELDLAYPGLTSCGDGERSDVYRFTLTEARKVKVLTQAICVDTTYANWHINFEREDGLYFVTMGTSVSSSGGTPTHYYTFLPGTYWVDIGKNKYGAGLVLYHLTLQTLEPAEDDDYEDNDFPDEAKPIAAGLLENLRGAYVDADYFSIDLAAGDSLGVTATEVTSTGATRRLVIVDPSGAWRREETNSDNPIVVGWRTNATGKHLIKTRWWSDGVIYDLNVEVTS
jgi:hypothetical protein